MPVDQHVGVALRVRLRWQDVISTKSSALSVSSIRSFVVKKYGIRNGSYFNHVVILVTIALKIVKCPYFVEYEVPAERSQF